MLVAVFSIEHTTREALKMASRSMDIQCKVYVGDLPEDVSEKELEREFSYYGRYDR